MALWSSFTVHNAVKFDNDGGCPRDGYFGKGFAKLKQHNLWNLPSTATKSSMLKFKGKKLKHLSLLESTLS